MCTPPKCSEHVADPALVLRELRRVVKADGRVVVSFPNEAMIDHIKGALISGAGLWRFFADDRGTRYVASARMGDEWHLHALSVAAVRQMTDSYFHVAAVNAVPTPLVPLRYVVAARPV